jgi:DNA N-6-adenine-methyltransferase Dam
MTATIRKRTKDEAPFSDSCNTPLWLNHKLGRFDFDPCSNDRSTVDAAWSFSLEKKLDGLRMPWRGRGYENWPYSDPEPWAEKSIYELREGNCTELVVLCKLDTSTDWWATITQPILFPGLDFPVRPDLWPFNARLQFDEPEELVEMRKQKRADAIERVYAAVKNCPRDSCFGKMGPGGRCDTRSGAPHAERAKAARITVPSEATSNNFCSVIVHHRGMAPILALDDVATRWVAPIDPLLLAARLGDLTIAPNDLALA